MIGLPGSFGLARSNWKQRICNDFQLLTLSRVPFGIVCRRPLGRLDRAHDTIKFKIRTPHRPVRIARSNGKQWIFKYFEVLTLSRATFGFFLSNP